MPAPTFLDLAASIDNELKRNIRFPSRNVVFADSPFAATILDKYVNANATGGNMLVTLPDATTCKGMPFGVKKTDVSGNTVTIQSAGGGQTIDGVVSKVLVNQNDFIVAVSDGANYKIYAIDIGAAATSGAVFYQIEKILKTDGVTTLVPVDGTLINFNVAVDGNCTFIASGYFAGSAGLVSADLYFTIDGVDYAPGGSYFTINGSGGDRTGPISLSPSITLFLSAGPHTVELKAAQTNLSLTATVANPLTLSVIFPGASSTVASPTPKAATYVVHPTPGVGDYTTIQAAITALIPLGGGYILVREGTYDMSAAVTNTIPADIPIVIVGCGDATVVNFGSNGIAAFTFPNGYSQRTNYVFSNMKFIFNATAGQDFIKIADAGGYVSVDVYNCSIYRPSKLVNFTAYDVSYTRANSVRFNGGNAVPLTGVSKLVEAPFPAGTYNGFVWIGFQDTLLDDDYGNAKWTFDADADIIISGTGSAGFFAVAPGSKCDGFAFDGNGLEIGDGDFTVYGAAYGGSYILSRSMGGDTGNSRIICFDISTRVQGYVFNLCFKVGSGASFPSAQFLGVWFANGGGIVMANPAVEMTGNAGVMSDCFFQAGYVNGCVKITDVKYCKIHDCNFAPGVTGKTVIESGTADENDIHDNTGLTNGTGYTIIGPKTKVDGAVLADKATSTTNALVEIVPTITNPKGLIGIGTIKNTDGANTLSVTETFTDAFGTSSTLTTDVAPGNYMPLNLQQAIGTGFAPYVSYKAEVIDKVAGNHATYVSHFTSQGSL